MPAYRRILIKLSGEALQDSKNAAPIEAGILLRIVTELAELYAMGIQIGLVIGAGNFFRASAAAALGIDRITADHMGMVSTVINALALRDCLENHHIPTLVMSAIPMTGIVEAYDRQRARRYLNENRLIIFAGGTGNPLVTTDSAASLRSIEIQADILLKATHVDGVYAEDPQKNPKALFYTHLSYQEVLQKELGVMDLAAFCQCRDNHMPIRIFNLYKPHALRRIMEGESEGTLVN